MPKFEIVQAVPRSVRKTRKPQHPFNIVMQPWALTPFMIAPVLPGETLENLMINARVVSDPIKSKLVGAWVETYVFYVKHRDLDQRTELINMHLTGSALTTDRRTSQNLATYAYDNGIDWVNACLKRVTEEYFRDEGEAWNTNLVGSYPAVQTKPDGWWGDSLVDDATAVPAINELQDDPDLDVMTTYQNQYERMRQMRATNWTFDDWLKVHGVNVPMPESEDEYKPELLRYSREWTYPTNSVEPTTGVPSSAWVWSVQERADKNRFFKEPGFIFGVMCVRPKVYYTNQKGAAVGALDEARLWFPALMRDEPYTSIKKFENTDVTNEGPLGTTATNDYWADMRDLFLYGDQFTNYDQTVAGNHGAPVALPTAALVDRYATATMADGLFAAASPANLIRVDGTAMFNIKGTVGPDQT